MINIRPLNNVVIVERLPAPTTSTGGIFLIKSDQSLRGKVLAVGNGVYDDKGKLVDSGVKVGDKIAYLESHEKEFEIDHEILVAVKANGILGKLTDE